MPLINLIHEQRADARTQERKRRTFGAVFAASAALSAGLWFVLFFQTEGVRSEQRAEQAKLDKMQPILDAISSSESQYRVLEPRLTTLQAAAMTTQRWAKILDYFSRSCPNGVFFKSIRASQGQEETPIVVEIQGIGPSQEAVSELILRIQGCQELESVNLSYTQGEILNSTQVIKFELNASIVGTAKPAPKPEEEKA